MRPLLVVDWGIGGLSVLRVLRQLVPAQPCLYFSDSGFTPYGRVPALALANRLMQLFLHFHEHFQVNRVLIACNAASTVIPELTQRTECRGLTISGVIEPGLRLVQACGKKRIAVIGGERTIASQIFSSRLQAQGFAVQEQVAQPLSALIEKGVLEGSELEDCLQAILSPLVGCEALLLACTHYPAVSAAIARLLPGVLLLDPARLAAEEMAASLGENKEPETAPVFFTSGHLAQTQAAAQLAFAVEWLPSALPEELRAP